MTNQEAGAALPIVLGTIRQRLVDAAEHQCTKRGDYLYKGHPDAWIADSINDLDALLAKLEGDV
jgi:hypothetical protein